MESGSSPHWRGGWKGGKNWNRALPEHFPALSAATIDWELSAFKLRKATQREDLIPLIQLKKSIPYAAPSKQPTQLGYLSADTVAHCNGDMSEDFVWTLTVTDELTSRTQNRAMGNEGQYATCQVLHHILMEVPFRVRTINTDNSSEFMNYHLQYFLKAHDKSCKVSRSCSNKKEENARVGDLNLHDVRECAGYERLDDERNVRELHRLYKYQDLLLIPFQTWMRVAGKEGWGSEVIRNRERTQTPYARLMEHLKEGKSKRWLKAQHEAHNPWELREKKQAAVKEILLLQEKLNQEQGGCALGKLAKGKKTE